MDQAKLDKLIANREKAIAGGGEAAVEKHHAKGSYTCRERINMLLDEGSFEEVNMFLTHRCHDFGMEKKVFLGDGVAVGSGTIDGRLVFVFAQDATVIGGSLSETMAQKICNVMDQAMKLGAPIIGLNDSGGARIQEGACALAGYAEIFERNILASGVVPQISVIFGPCAGGAVYSPALTDFIMMTEQNSYMFITGPKVVKSVTGEDVTVEQLGGAHIHATKSGVTHFVAATEEEALAEVRRLVSFIPQNNMEEAPVFACTDDITRVDDNLNDIVPDDPNKPYDMHEIINTIVDNGDFMEVHKDYAKNVICGFARFNGRSTGIIANQPSWLAGQEYAGIIDHGAKLMFAYGEATVPKVTITVRKSYGGSHIVMSCKQLRGDMCYAWPNAEIAVMGASGAVGVLQAKAIKAIEDPAEKKAFIAEKEAEYKDLFASPYQAANRGYIDDVIEPRYTRSRIIRAFEMLQTKRLTNPLKKHSNIPL